MAAFFDNDKREWHVGEPIPERVLNERVVTIQADGDELDVILHALQLTQVRKFKGGS